MGGGFMIRRVITLLSIVSPLLLIFICVSTFALTAITGWWWLSGPDDKSRIIRIVSLAPLATPQLDPTSQIQEPAPSAPETNAPESAVSSAEVENTQPSQNNAPLTPEEVAQQLGFALPEGAINSINQIGVADRLVIPKLNLDSPVILSPIENRTWKVDHLGQSVGHLEGTAPPGSSSNIVLAAHVTLSQGVYGPFAGLGQLAVGDVIYVYDGAEVYEYMIDGFQTVDRTAVEVTHPSQTGEITLITCNNWSDTEGRYLERLIVKGHLIEG